MRRRLRIITFASSFLILLAGLSVTPTTYADDSSVGEVDLVSTTYPGDVRLTAEGPSIWSPDGTKILFRGQTQNPGSPSSISDQFYVKDVSSISTPTLVSALSDGTFLPILQPISTWSPDGTKIGFSNYGPPNSSGAAYQGYIKNLPTGSPTALNASSSTCDGPLGEPFWNPDGTKYAATLNPGIQGASLGVCVVDLHTNGATLVSTRADGTPASGVFLEPSWSPDDTKIAFVSADLTLTSGLGPEASYNIFIKDLQTGNLTPVRTAVSIGGYGSRFGILQGPMWNKDSSKIAFATDSNLAPNDTNSNAVDVYVADAATGAMTYVSQAADGEAGNASSEEPVWSPTNPNELAFASRATNLLNGVSVPAESGSHIYVKNLTALASDSFEGIDTPSTKTFANGSAAEPWWSPDGQSLAFTSDATNLFPGATDNAFYRVGQVYARNLVTGAITLVSGLSNTTPGDGGSQLNAPMFAWRRSLGAWSPDCSSIVFSSSASNLVPESSGNQIYVKHLGTSCSTSPSPSPPSSSPTPPPPETSPPSSQNPPVASNHPCAPVHGGIGKRLLVSLKCKAAKAILGAKCTFAVASILFLSLKTLHIVEIAKGIDVLSKVPKRLYPIAKLFYDLSHDKYLPKAPVGYRSFAEVYKKVEDAQKAIGIIKLIPALYKALAKSDFNQLALDLDNILGLRPCVQGLANLVAR